jgi:hypothetical protein
MMTSGSLLVAMKNAVVGFATVYSTPFPSASLTPSVGKQAGGAAPPAEAKS